MNLDSGDKIPMLVVLSQVGNVEEALEAATCQVCLVHQGSTDRGLYELLKKLGLKDEDESPPPREAVVVVHAREEHAVPTVGVVVSGLRPREVAIVDPLMGTAIQVTRPMEPPARNRGSRTPCRYDWRLASSKSQVPRALRDAGHVSEPVAPVVHFTGAIGESGGNAAVLRVAMEVAKERDEAKWRERTEKFGKLMYWLKLTLAKIRKRARTKEVWDLVETFERKLAQAAKLDAQQRGKKNLLATLGTSMEGLEGLCLRFYQPRERMHVLNPDVVTVDAFEGGRRPESWDQKGGKKPAFYEFEVVRTKRSLPVPRPLIDYPEGGEPTGTTTTPALPATT